MDGPWRYLLFFPLFPVPIMSPWTESFRKGRPVLYNLAVTLCFLSLLWFSALQKRPEDINRRSADMWSFAVLLWELVTREVPFADLSHMEIGMKVSGFIFTFPRANGLLHVQCHSRPPRYLHLRSFLRWLSRVCVQPFLPVFRLTSVNWWGSAWTKTQPKDPSLTWSSPS